MNNLDWNAGAWADCFWMLKNAIERDGNLADRDALCRLRMDAYWNTVNLVRCGKYRWGDGWYCFDEAEVDAMVKGTRMYRECFDVREVKTGVECTEVRVENRDCLLVARDLQQEGYRVAVLNMANRQNPGGGVQTGSGAQEENLFRRTNLFRSLYQYAWYGERYGVRVAKERYPMDRNFGGVYTPNAIVFRGLEGDGYPLLMDPYRVSVITVAGMNRPRLTMEGMIEGEFVEGIRNKIRTIFRIGLSQGHDALVLGALGCGAFRNPPKHVARLFHEVMEDVEFRNKFRLIDFAILEDHNSNLKHNREGNFKPFAEEMGVLNVE